MACLYNAVTEVNIFSKPHFTESVQFEIHIPSYAHVEGAWIELVHGSLLLATSNASCREERGHAVRDCFLDVGERFVCCIGTSESIARILCQLFLDGSQIPFRQDAVAVKDKRIFAFRVFHAIVACRPRTAILLREVLDVKLVRVLLHGLFAWHSGTILHHHHFKVVDSLTCQALK